MPGEIQLTVITPERTVLKQVETGAVVLPVAGGSMGVLPRHTPMVAALRIGVLKYRGAGRYEPLAISGGFAEVTADRVTVLAEAAERAAEINVLRARAALDHAEARLRQRGADLDEARARAALQRALVRLRVAEAAQGERRD